jgi:hypothetical protein
MQQRGQPCAVGWFEPDPLPVELALQHRELVAQDEGVGRSRPSPGLRRT